MYTYMISFILNYRCISNSVDYKMMIIMIIITTDNNSQNRQGKCLLTIPSLPAM